MDLTDTIVPRSDQLNSDDLMSGPRTFTIEKVERGSAEQPVNIYLVEFPNGRPWRPSKSMLRVLVMVWGKESSEYAGRRLTLYRDPEIRFGPDKVGGVRVSHMSHLPKRVTMALTEKRGSRKPFTVEPLPDTAPASPAVSPDTLAELTATFDRKGIPEDARLSGVNQICGGSATDLETITEDEARKVLTALANRPDVPTDSPTPADA